MPQNTTITVSPEWTLLTDANVTDLTFQVIGVGGGPVFIAGTNGTTAPADDALGLSYEPGQGEADRALADLFPGVSGVNRLWAKTSAGSTGVFVSHA